MSGTWTPPADPGNIPVHGDNMHWDSTNQCISTTTPINRLDIIPQPVNPGGTGTIWVSSVDGNIHVGNSTVGSTQSTQLDSLTPTSGTSTPLAITPAGSNAYTNIPAWTGGFLVPATNTTWTATAGSIAMTYTGTVSRYAKFSFSLTGTPGTANKVYGFNVSNGLTTATGVTVQQNFPSTTLPSTVSFSGIIPVAPGAVLSVKLAGITDTTILTASEIVFTAWY